LGGFSPISPDTGVALSSPGRTIDGLAAATAASDVDWRSRTAMNLPALTTPRANRLGRRPSASFEEIIRSYLAADQ